MLLTLEIEGREPSKREREHSHTWYITLEIEGREPSKRERAQPQDL